MARWHGTTTQRGYGYAHQQLVRAARAAYVAGQPCARCGKPIWPAQPVDLGHADGTAKQQYAGLEHRSCNRAAGARLKNRRARAQRVPSWQPAAWQPSREW